MAIFARLVCLLFAIGFSAGLAGASAAVTNPYWKEGPYVGAAVGAIVGIFIGRSLGIMIAGKPPKD